MTTNAEMISRREAAIPRGLATATGIFADKAENAEIWDVEGRRFIDFAGGIAVLNTGHRHPKVMASVAAQSERFTHTAFQVMAYDSYIELAERLNNLVPIENAKTLLMNSGAEAVENAVKIARAHTGRGAVIAFNGAFHGRSLLTMGLTGKVLPYKAKFGPFPGEIYHAPFPIEHHGISMEQSLAALEWLFKVDVEPSQVAAIIIEPVQGEGGFYVAPQAFMERIREICTEHGIVMIADEVQTGFARTGKLLAIEHYGIEPDLIVMAKSLAGGYPLSAISGKAEIMDAPDPGGLGSTYGGSPIGCAAALAVIEVIEDEDLCARAIQIGEHIKERVQRLKERNDTPPIGDVRGLGAMIAFEMVKGRGAHEPDPAMAKALVTKAEANGLVILPCGVFGNSVRILVPLTASEEVVDEGLDIIEKSMIEIAGA
ncbi:MAG: 4-aminobutyrate--2-oxoglutarate transaminase [Pseudomonadota bacterium]